MSGKSAKPDPYARRFGESHFDHRARVARLEQAERDRSQPIVPAEAAKHGSYVDSFILHGESGTLTRTPRNRASSVVERWFSEGHPGFEQPARSAIDKCLALWEARPIVGKLCASYSPTIRGGEPANDYGVLDALDDTRMLGQFQGWFHPAHWRVFENVVRWGEPAGKAGSELANNEPQSIASARTVVGLVANFIALRMGYA